MGLLEHAWHWLSTLPGWAVFAGYFGGAAGVLWRVLVGIAKRRALAVARAWVAVETETDDEPTVRKQLAADGWVSLDHHRQVVGQLAADNDALRAENRILRAALGEREGELAQVRGDREALQYRLANMTSHALHLRKELAGALGVDEDSSSLPPPPRSPSGTHAPVTHRPPPTPLVLEGDADPLKVTPAGGMTGVRAPRTGE